MSGPERDQLFATLDAVSALVQRLRAHKAERNLREAERDLEQGYTLLGLQRRELQVTPAADVHLALRHPELIRTLAELLAQEADILRMEGDKDAAAATARWTLTALLHNAPPGDYSQLTRALVAMSGGREPDEAV